ncbi:MAG: MMPL family transporter [Pseudomonadota bacterium]
MRILLARPFAALLLALVVAVGCGYGATRLTVNSDNRILFPANDENRRKLDLFEARYASQSNLIIALHAREGGVFTSQRLAAIAAVTEGAWRLPYATRVDSVTNATHISSDAGGVVIEDMAPTRLIEGAPGEVASRVLTDNLLLNRLASADGATVAVNIDFDYPLGDSAAVTSIHAAVDELLEQAGVDAAGLDAWRGGRVASSGAFSDAVKTDMKTLTPLAYLAIFALVGTLLRSASLSIALLVSAILATVSAMGIAGWLGLSLSSTTANIPTIIVTLGAATLIHIITHYQSAYMQLRDKGAAVDQAISECATPVSLALGTTAIGFLSLNFADAPPFRDLGNIIAIGAGCLMFFGFTATPALLRLLPARSAKGTPPLEMTVSRTADFIIANRRVLAFGLPPAFLLVIAGVQLIKIDDDFVRFFDESYAYRLDSENIETHLTGLDVLEFDVGSSEENAVFDPAYLKKLDAFEDWLRAQPKITYVATMAETFKRLNRHMTTGAEDAHVIPDSPDAVAQYLLAYEMSLPLGRTLTDSITLDRSRTRVTAVMTKASTAEVRSLTQQAERWLETYTPEKVVGSATGLGVMYAYLTTQNLDAMTVGNALAIGLISLVLIAAFRSLKYGLISLVPNLLPAAIAFGVWGYAVGQVGVVASAVGALTLGIIVDDTVHLMWRYQRARRDGETPEAAVRLMLRDVGRPMLTSTLALIAGFAVLGSSGFEISASLGALSAITVAAALLADWFFLAPLLLAVDGRQSAGASRPVFGNPFRKAGAAPAVARAQDEDRAA